jgi:hypothetical protein
VDVAKRSTWGWEEVTVNPNTNPELIRQICADRQRVAATRRFRRSLRVSAAAETTEPVARAAGSLRRPRLALLT